MRPPNGARCGTPFLLFAAGKLVTVGGGVDGVKLGVPPLFFLLPLLQWDDSESDADGSVLFFLPFLVVPAI